MYKGSPNAFKIDLYNKKLKKMYCYNCKKRKECKELLSNCRREHLKDEDTTIKYKK